MARLLERARTAWCEWVCDDGEGCGEADAGDAGRLEAVGPMIVARLQRGAGGREGSDVAAGVRWWGEWTGESDCGAHVRK